jgi:hypothetical protein
LEQVGTKKRNENATNATPKKEQGENRNEKVKEIAGRIGSGQLRITRLKPEEEAGRIAGGRRNVEASVIVGAEARANQAASRGRRTTRKGVCKERGKKNSKGKIERFSLTAILDALNGSDVATARDSLSPLVGAVVDVSGKVQKRVKRDGQCKLVIEPGDVPGFVVFADCLSDAENLTKLNIRKGSLVRVKGKLRTFGASAVCLSDCRLRKLEEDPTKPNISEAIEGRRRNKKIQQKSTENRTCSTRTRTECKQWRHPRAKL